MTAAVNAACSQILYFFRWVLYSRGGIRRRRFCVKAEPVLCQGGAGFVSRRSRFCVKAEPVLCQGGAGFVLTLRRLLAPRSAREGRHIKRMLRSKLSLARMSSLG